MQKVVSIKIWSNAAYMKANDREHMEAFICEYQGECPMYALGKCVCENLVFGWIKCPHSKLIKDEGMTKRSKSFGAAASRWREQYKTDIKIENQHLCQCGDYIFLPYPHLCVFGVYKFDESIVNEHFIPVKLFDVFMINKIVNHHPHSLMGGEITKFQEKEVPKFIQHLSDFSPALFEEYQRTYPDQKDRFLSIAQNYIGRKAYLHTLKDGAYFFDCHKLKWTKENGFIVCENYAMSLGLPAGKKPRKCMQGITDDMIVDVKENDFVMPETVFVN